jgi:hypothetical protein
MLAQFDSPSNFGHILNTRVGHWGIHSNIETVGKQNYVSVSNILQTGWIHETGRVTLTNFAIHQELKEGVKQPRGPVLIRKLDCLRGCMAIEVEVYPRPNW